jgi:hypothetical protein
MSITDAQYDAWLAGDNPRCLLIEAKCWHGGDETTGQGGAEITRYLSNLGYVSGPADAPANQPYDDILANSPSLSMGIDQPLAVGTIEVWNLDGSLDGWLDDSWDGRDIAWHLGDPSWPRADFRQIFAGTVDNLAGAGQQKLALNVRDRKERLNLPIQLSQVPDGPNAGELIPVALGVLFNAEPQYRQPPGYDPFYLVHDGPFYGVLDVRANGVGAAFIGLPQDGIFFITSGVPVGRVTADFNGAVGAGGVLIKWPAECVQYLVETRAGFAGWCDADNFDAFDDRAQIENLAIGKYIRSRENLLAVIDEIAASVGSYWHFDRAGKIRIWRLDAPVYGAAARAFDVDDFAEGGLELDRIEPPVRAVRLGQKKNWSVQDKDGLADAVSAADRELYGAEYGYVATAANSTVPGAVTFENDTLLLVHPGAPLPDLQGTLIAHETATEAVRRASLRRIQRRVYKASLNARAIGLNLGDQISVVHPRLGFAAGADAIVIGIEESPSLGKVVLTLWR